MNQRDLKVMLDEAASPDTSRSRKNQIGDKLVHLAPIYLDQVIKKLYTDTVVSRPDLLPFLFPFFAVICGDREPGSNLADVDWSLV